MLVQKLYRALVAALLFVFIYAVMVNAAPVKITYMGHNTLHETETALLKEFHDLHPEIEVELLSLSSLAAIKEQLTTMIAGGIAPDVVFGWETADWASQGVLLGLDRFIDNSTSVGRDDFIPGVWDYHLYQGSSYGIPYVFWSPTFFYNKDIFDTTGVAEPSSTWGWNELRETTSRLSADRNGDGAVDRWGLRLSSQGYIYGIFLATNGGFFFDFSDRRPTFNSPKGIETMEYLVSLVNGGHASHTQGSYANQTAAMSIEGPWGLTQLRDQNIDSGLRPIPAGQCCNRSLAGGEGLWIVQSGNADREAASWKLIEFLTQPDQQAIMATGSGYLPARLGAYHHPVYMEVIAEEPLIQEFAHIAQTTSVAYPDWVGAEIALRQIITKWFREALDGSISPLEALEQAEWEIEAMYGEIDVPWK